MRLCVSATTGSRSAKMLDRVVEGAVANHVPGRDARGVARGAVNARPADGGG